MFVDSHYGAFPDDTAEIYPASFSKSPQNSEENIVPIDSVVDASTRFVDFPSGLGMTIAKRPPSSSSIFEKIDKLSFANAADKVRVGLKRTSISFGLLLRTQSDRENCDVWKHTLYERDVEEKDVCINNDSDIPMQREVQRKENLVRMLKCETTEFGTRELFGKSAKLAKPFELNVNEIQQRTSEHDDFSNLLDFSQSYKNQFWNEMKLQSRDSYSSKKLKAPELPPPEPFFPDSNKHSNSSLRKLIKDHGFQMFTKSHMSQRELSLRWDPLKALSNLLPSEFLTQLITNRIDVLFDGVPTTLDSVAKIKSLYEISVDETETRQVNSDYDTEKLLSWAEQGVSLLIEILKSKKAKNSSKITKKREFERNDSEVIDLDEFDIRDNVESRKVKGEIEPVQIFSSPILDSTMESGAEEMFIKSSPNDVPWKFSKKVEPVKALKSGGSVLNDKSAGFPNKSNSTGALKLNRKASNSSNRIESSSNIKKFSTLVGRNLQSNNTAGSESQTFDGSDILASNFSASDRVSKLMQFRGYHKRRKIVVKEAQNLTPAPVQPSNTMDSIAPKIEIEQMPVPEVNLLPVPTPWEKIETIQDLSSFDQQEKGQRHTYIASTNFALCRRDVVPILEQQMRIDLVEREFRYFRCGAKFLRDVDLIIDERTCVIIHPIISLSQNVPGGDVECLDEVNHLIELFWKQVEKMDVNDDLDSEEYDDEPIENVLLRISKK
ncbi:hypothetical protein HK098_002231 [Nowakowskiella sp. JEL0407]|nr:hypothetical protein HK098_002231 [Nowakowskiella sp. JEL0407]